MNEILLSVEKIILTCPIRWVLHFQEMKYSTLTNQFLLYPCIFSTTPRNSQEWVKLIFCYFVYRFLLSASKGSFSLSNCLLKWLSRNVSWTWSFNRTLHYTKTRILFLKCFSYMALRLFPLHFYASTFYSENGCFLHCFCNIEMHPKNIFLEINL